MRKRSFSNENISIVYLSVSCWTLPAGLDKKTTGRKKKLPVSPLCVEYSFKSAEYTTPAEFCCPTVRKLTIRAPRHTTHPQPPSGGVSSWWIWFPGLPGFLSVSKSPSHLSSNAVSDMKLSFLFRALKEFSYFVKTVVSLKVNLTSKKCNRRRTDVDFACGSLTWWWQEI